MLRVLPSRPDFRSFSMRLAAIDRMTPSMPDFANLYVTIEQLPARRTTGILLGTLMLFAAALLSPFYMIATTALADQALRDAVSTRPIASLQILTGLAFWLVLLGFPIYRLLNTLTRSRTIEIADGRVTVVDQAFGHATSWSAPMTEFLGIAPYLRASLSGVRHELVLVHPDRSRSLLIAMAPRLMQSELDQVASALGLPELAPQMLRERPLAAA
ncbi:MAG: hypothetical protein C0519_15595 [Hyphomicrobium sp.]|nr:hypothetical protein [Hyphomicrobium sp.]